MPVFIDANILLYARSKNPKEQAKQAIAFDLLQSAECVVSVQVLQEFFVQATKSNREFRLSAEMAEAIIVTWRRFRIVEMTESLMFRAFAIKQQSQISYWDAAVVAAAEYSECEVLLTEDLNHGQKIGSVKTINPFISI